MAKRIPAVLIGAGSIAEKVYAPLLAGSTDFDLLAILSKDGRSAAQLAERYHIGYGGQSWPKATSQCQVAFVVSSTSSHASVIRKAITEGMHVYSEKPLVDDLQTARELVQLAIQKQKQLFVAFNRRTAPLYVLAKQQLLGQEPTTLVIEKPMAVALGTSLSTLLYDDVIHLVDLMMMYLGEPNDYQVRYEAFHQSLTLSVKVGNSLGLLRYGPMYGGQERLSISTSTASLQVLDMAELQYRSASGDRIVTADKWQPTWEKRGFSGAVRAFATLLAGPITAPSLASHMLIDSMRLSFDLTNL